MVVGFEAGERRTSKRDFRRELMVAFCWGKIERPVARVEVSCSKKERWRGVMGDWGGLVAKSGE